MAAPVFGAGFSNNIARISRIAQYRVAPHFAAPQHEVQGGKHVAHIRIPRADENFALEVGMRGRVSRHLDTRTAMAGSA